ncbi:MAG TPA: hypothetical protein VGD43_08305, partial [Micromonospora sp.]
GATTGHRPPPAVTGGVRSLPKAAHQAARHAGTEVSRTEVAGHDHGPDGRWAQLRRRVRFGAWRAPRPTVDSQVPAQPVPEGGTDPSTVEERT